VVVSRPLISVIIPTYNRAAYVQQAVQSVLDQQGGFSFEIIVVDDGSTPATADALRRFGDAIRVVRQENAGLNPARNHGLRLVRGEYVALLDDDDVWLPGKTLQLMAPLERYPDAGFVHSNFFIWKPERDERRPDGLRSWFPRPYAWDEIYEQHARVRIAGAGLDDAPLEVDAHAGDVYYWSLFAPMVLPSTAIIRRDALEAGQRFPEMDSVGDWEFFARFSRRCGAVFVPIETTLNRSHHDAVRLTRTDPAIRLQRRVGLIDRVWRQDRAFMRKHGAEVNAVEAGCLRRLARLSIAAGKGADARSSLRAVRAIGAPAQAKDALLWGLSSAVPVAQAGVALIRSVRRHLPNPTPSGY
jgi:glycosyltransferase involved in cell wall biosynthesis